MAKLKASEIAEVKGRGFLINRGTEFFSGRVVSPNTVFSAQDMKVMTEIAEKFGNGTLVPTARLAVEIPGIPYEKIQEAEAYAEERGLCFGGTGAKVRPVAACKGTTCIYGNYDTQGLAKKIYEQFYVGWKDVKLPHKFKIAVGGCPNNCVKPNLNDLGIIGQRIPHFKAELCKGCKKCSVEAVCPMGAAKVSDKKLHIDENVCIHCGRCVGNCRFDSITDGTYGFKIFVGGRWGKKISHGRALSKVFTTKDEAMDVIEKAILLFRERGLAGERFAVMIDRIGFETVEEALLRDDSLLERKEEILSREL